MEGVVSLNILGQDILVKSPEGEEAARRVASHLEEKIEEVRKTTGTAGSLRLLLYAALQMADENVRVKDELSRLEEKVESVSSRILEIIDLK